MCDVTPQSVLNFKRLLDYRLRSTCLGVSRDRYIDKPLPQRIHDMQHLLTLFNKSLASLEALITHRRRLIKHGAFCVPSSVVSYRYECPCLSDRSDSLKSV